MPLDVTYRFATASDIAAVVALVESAYRGEASRAGWTTEADLLDGQRTDADEVAAVIADPLAELMLAVTTADELVGCCQLTQQPGGTCYFGMFAVDPLRQRDGLGHRLIAAAERWAIEQWDATTMHLTVLVQRRELIEWYARRGYRRTGETKPFPYGDERFGKPRRSDLHFEVLAKPLREPSDDTNSLT